LNENATNEVIRDGWFHTSDLGYISRDGMITITGRAKEVIVLSSGKNIYPEEVEKHYENTPLVREICVIPVEGGDGRVERVCMVVVPDYRELTARHVANVCERIESELAIVGCTLPSYMRITDLVLFEGELPRTRLGKLRRSKIAEQVMEQKQSGHETKTVPIPQELIAQMENPASARFLKHLEEVTEVNGPFSPNQDLAMDLGIDSLTQIQLAVVLEDEFGVRIPDEELASVRTATSSNASLILLQALQRHRRNCLGLGD
ncbi:MAG TPA: phosphopantetheine-binding protein, partial [Dehalococcoidia bacterium]